jgi:hypothetical protein
MTEEETLYRAGFRPFVHLRREERDGKKRLIWMGVLSGKLSAIRVMEIELGWQVEYVSPDVEDSIRQMLMHYSIIELIAFVERSYMVR